MILAPALDEILPQIGLDMVVGTGSMARRDADETHHQRFAAAGMDIDSKLMGQIFFVTNVFLNVVPIHDDGTMFFRHVYPPQDFASDRSSRSGGVALNVKTLLTSIIRVMDFLL
jgi:hypothetical protein